MDWLEAEIPRLERPELMRRLQAAAPSTVNPEDWTIADSEFPRVGSYTAYGVFLLHLEHLTRGDPTSDYESDEEDWDIELEALARFRSDFKPASVTIEGSSHFLDVGDTDTIFVPVAFPQPIEWNETWVGSVPVAMHVLEQFAASIGFDLRSSFDPEELDQRWHPVNTSRNIARILFQFFAAKPDACVAFV
jgi:hypothetical protein